MTIQKLTKIVGKLNFKKEKIKMKMTQNSDNDGDRSQINVSARISKIEHQKRKSEDIRFILGVLYFKHSSKRYYYIKALIC